MAKKSIDLDGTLDPGQETRDTGIAQRGASKASGSRRLSLTLDEATYQRLRKMGFDAERTHQDIMATAIADYLNKHNA